MQQVDFNRVTCWIAPGINDLIVMILPDGRYHYVSECKDVLKEQFNNPMDAYEHWQQIQNNCGYDPLEFIGYACESDYWI